MKFDPKTSAFGRHETFPLRYGWLTKAIQSINKQGITAIFKQPEDAMTDLGLGKNMVNALQYWLQVTNIMTFEEDGAHLTDFGRALLGADGDPYLEDEATIWIIHWRIAANPKLATGFFWFFNHFSMPRFKSADVLHSLTDFVNQEKIKSRSESTLKSDVSTLLRMYAPTAGRNDEHLDSPMSLLGLLSSDASGGYLSQRTVRPFLPPVALHFALQRLFSESRQAALPINILLYGGDGYPAPGAVFRLNEEGLMAALAKVIETYPHCYELRETSGLHQLYLREQPRQETAVLAEYYQGRSA